MKIGIDLDNTLIDYSQPFLAAGQRLGFLPINFKGSKADIRAYLRGRSETVSLGEMHWQQLQFVVYASEILSAQVFPHALDFIQSAIKKGHQLSIISHKTVYAAQDRAKTINLQKQAMKWVDAQLNLVCDDYFQLDRNVFFLETRQEKIQQIQTCDCDLFIDDLIEVLQDNRFPECTQKVWFCPDHLVAFSENKEIKDLEVKAASSWKELCHLL